MIMEKKKVLIAYFSPAGSTRHVAGVIEKRFRALGTDVWVLDLGECRDGATEISRHIEELKGNTCLFIGSPVYVSHAVPRVMECIEGLSENTGAFAVPFVTWGGACSGIALYEMGNELMNKGFTLLGAAKILAVHSLMWQLDHPLGNGHPDSDDDRMAEDLVNHIQHKLHSDIPKGIALADLAYQTKENHLEMEKVSLEAAKAHMPGREIDRGLCNQCQICKEVCPMDAIELTPYPEFGHGCIFCFSCMKQCPEQAIKTDLSELWQRIKDRASFFSENPHSQIFL